MSHIESSLMRLNKDDLVRIILDCQGKFSNILDELKNNLNELKTNFFKIESDLHISRNINDKLSEKIVVLERKCHANEQHSKNNASKYRAFLQKCGISIL